MFEGKDIEGGRELRFSATLENIDLAADEMERFLAGVPGTEPIRFGALVGLREALLNSVVHGSRGDPALAVRCRFLVREGSLEIEISDSGAGFDWRAQAAASPDVHQEGGRGLSIIRTFFDQVGYNEPGNYLVLTKRLP